MIPPTAEHDAETALQRVGTGVFPAEWKSTFFHAAAIIGRLCAPSSFYVKQAERIVNDVNAIGSSGVLYQGWDSPKGNMAAILIALLSEIKSGTLWRGLWDAKNETCTDILQQADDLLEKNYFAAATVLAGGALEAHLKDLCLRNNISWNGDGTIAKYQGALSQAQNKGDISFFSTEDGKFITAWGGLRNRAAHSPAQITQIDLPGITGMLNGIRDFIKRIP